MTAPIVFCQWIGGLINRQRLIRKLINAFVVD